MISEIAKRHDRRMEWLSALGGDELLALAYLAQHPSALEPITGCVSCSPVGGLCFGCGRAPCVCLCFRCRVRMEIKSRVGDDLIRQMSERANKEVR